MSAITIREPTNEDKDKFLAVMQHSQSLHHPWVQAPITSQEFDQYLQRYQLPNQKSFLVMTPANEIAGVFNVSEIVRGLFQNAYLGFYAVIDFAGKGYMSAGLKLVLDNVFTQLNLHRLEANIQPKNYRSKQLIKKNGFRYEGFSPRYLKINGEWCGHEHWAMTYEDFIRDNADVVKKDSIDLIPYNSAWPEMAAKAMQEILDVIPKNKIIDIQHVGSTAIQGLSAKPIIDIQIAVHSLAEMKVIAVPELQKLGYEYWYENPDPSRMFFVKGMPPFGEKRTHHVHIVEHDSDHWRNKILFRNYLRENPSIAKEYEQLKKQLANEHAYDREKYTDEKSEFINRVLKLAKK